MSLSVRAPTCTQFLSYLSIAAWGVTSRTPMQIYHHPGQIPAGGSQCQLLVCAGKEPSENIPLLMH